MAVATATAIGLGIAAASAGASFAQAGKQSRLRREAESAADKAMQEARKALDVNFYESLAIQKEPYELEREALRAAGAQAIQAGVESERGAAATVGRVAMAQNEAQAGVRTAMGKELMDLEKMTAQEESRLRDVGVQLSLEEVAGAQQAASDAQRAQAAAIAQGAQSLTSAGQQIMANAALYGKSNTPEEIVKPTGPTSVDIGRVNQFKQTQSGLNMLRSDQSQQARLQASKDYYNQFGVPNPFDIYSENQFTIKP